eukprot:7492381-Pyramimonas_sp.AAC.1
MERCRQAARIAALEYMGNRAARVALDSRPRVAQSFKPGDRVAVWRRGRGIPGKKAHARWRGSA